MVTELIGWMANACFVTGYILVSQGKIDGAGKLFNYLNLGGAILFGTYAFIVKAYPVLALEIFWGTIAIVALRKVYLKEKESTLLEEKLREEQPIMTTHDRV